MLYDAKLSQDFAARLQDEGVFVTGFYYPVVPKGQALSLIHISVRLRPRPVRRERAGREPARRTGRGRNRTGCRQDQDVYKRQS